MVAPHIYFPSKHEFHKIVSIDRTKEKCVVLGRAPNINIALRQEYETESYKTNETETTTNLNNVSSTEIEPLCDNLFSRKYVAPNGIFSL